VYRGEYRRHKELPVSLLPAHTLLSKPFSLSAAAAAGSCLGCTREANTDGCVWNIFFTIFSRHFLRFVLFILWKTKQKRVDSLWYLVSLVVLNHLKKIWFPGGCGIPRCSPRWQSTTTKTSSKIDSRYGIFNF
jgi:hypothetical protein